jgi:hypothetical protein
MTSRNEAYKARPVKRKRSTRAELARVDQAIVAAVRQTLR